MFICFAGMADEKAAAADQANVAAEATAARTMAGEFSKVSRRLALVRADAHRVFQDLINLEEFVNEKHKDPPPPIVLSLYCRYLKKSYISKYNYKVDTSQP